MPSRVLRRLVLVGVVLASTAVAAPASARADPARWLLGYYVGYLRDQMPVREIDWSALTHIVVGPVTPRADGTLDTTFDIDASAGPAMAKSIARNAVAHAVTPLLMIGGAGTHDAFLNAARSHRVSFEKRLLAKMNAYGYQGLDLDWEPVDDADQPVLARLISDLRAMAPNAVLTMPVGWVNPNYQTVPPFYAQIAANLDRVNVMTYGMAGTWSGWQSWHSSALHGGAASTPSAVDAIVALYEAGGVPAAKLGVGIGFYGSCWTAPVTGPRQPIGGSTIVADDNVMSYVNIQAHYYTAAAYHYDSVAQAPYLSYRSPHGAQGCTYISYEDPTSVTAKGQWAQAQGLGALIVWNINEGHVLGAPAGQRDVLLTTARTAFGA